MLSSGAVSDHLPLSACSRGLTWFPSATAVLFYVLNCLSSSTNSAETWCWGAYITNFCSLRTCAVSHKRRNGRVHGWNQSQGMNVDFFFFVLNWKGWKQNPNASFPYAGWIPESLAGLAHWTSLSTHLLCSLLRTTTTTVLYTEDFGLL